MSEAKNGDGAGKRICDQVEYYFGDINLPRDKFLQEEMKKDCGWIPMETMLKFNRLAAITTDVAKIADALENSHLIEVSDNKTKIRRDPEVPMPENTLEYWQEIKKRTTYVKGFPLDATLDDVMRFATPFGEVHNVLLRRTVEKEKGKPRLFKGSVFITWKDRETAENFVKDENSVTFKDSELIRKMQEDYWTDKQAMIKKHREETKAMKEAKRKQVVEEKEKKASQAHFLKGSVLKVQGFRSEGEEKLDIAVIKEFFRKYGDVGYVAAEPDCDTVKIRLNTKSEGEAELFWKKVLEEIGEDGKAKYNDKLLTGEVLTGAEEEDYWTKFNVAKINKQERLDQTRAQKQNRQKRGRDADGGTLKAGGKKARKERADGDGAAPTSGEKRPAQTDPADETEIPKKSQRIVFNEKDDDGGGDVEEEDDGDKEGDEGAETEN